MSPFGVFFEGGSGHVLIMIVDGRAMRMVEVETREFDDQVKYFLEAL
jgi:hypothetical protein